MEAFPPPHEQPPVADVPPPPTMLEPAATAAAPAAEPSGRWKRWLGLGLAGTLLALGGGAVGGYIAAQQVDEPAPRPSVTRSDNGGSAASDDDDQDSGIDVAPAADASGGIDVLAVAEAVAPSVVTISADIDAENAPIPGGGTSVGTGVILNGEGDVLTNAHVVNGASEIRVRLNGETEPIGATLLAADPINDLALLHLDGDGYPAATFAEPGSTQIGDPVVAIGFALDLDGDPSVTLGIVSALDRTLNMGNSEILDGLIQTDAAISSGNSGGPLVNNRGEVVGINTAVARGDIFTAATNVGFAISVAEVQEVLPQLRDQADGIERSDGYLGVQLLQRTDGGQGALIGEVSDGTPAADAGLQTDDLVIAVDGSAIDGADALVGAIRDRAPGDTVVLTVVRDGDELDIDVKLAERPEDL